MHTLYSGRYSRRRAGLPHLLLCLMLAGCGGSLTRHGPIDPALAALIPSDAMALAGVRIDQVRATPIYRKLAERNRLPGFNAFRAQSGFDPNQDIRELLLSSDGVSVLALARGTFREKPSGNLNTSEYRGYSLYTNDGRDAMAFLTTSLVVGGPSPAVRAAIDQYKSGRDGAPRDLMARADALPADAQIWAVIAGWPGATPEQLREMGNWGNLDRVLRLVAGASLTVDLRTGMRVAFTGDCRSDADAGNLADSFRGLAAMAKMGVQRGHPDLLAAFDGIQIKQDGRMVQVKIDTPEDLAEKLVR